MNLPLSVKADYGSGTVCHYVYYIYYVSEINRWSPRFLSYMVNGYKRFTQASAHEIPLLLSWTLSLVTLSWTLSLVSLPRFNNCTKLNPRQSERQSNNAQISLHHYSSIDVKNVIQKIKNFKTLKHLKIKNVNKN